MSSSSLGELVDAALDSELLVDPTRDLALRLHAGPAGELEQEFRLFVADRVGLAAVTVPARLRGPGRGLPTIAAVALGRDWDANATGPRAEL